MIDDRAARLDHIRALHRDRALPCTHEERGLLLDEIDRLTARVAEQEQYQATRVTDHTFEGTPGPGNRCETELFGQTCGAPWEQHELHDEP